MIKFPYIKQGARDTFDPLLAEIQKVPTIIAGKISRILLNMNYEEREGAVNYIITKLVMNKEKIDKNTKSFIRDIMVSIYINNLKYYKINAFTGLIDNILDNLYERGWDTEANLIYLCELLVDYKEKYVRPYEKKKLEEHGDLV